MIHVTRYFDQCIEKLYFCKDVTRVTCIAIQWVTEHAESKKFAVYQIYIDYFEKPDNELPDFLTFDLVLKKI